MRPSTTMIASLLIAAMTTIAGCQSTRRSVSGEIAVAQLPVHQVVDAAVTEAENTPESLEPTVRLASHQTDDESAKTDSDVESVPGPDEVQEFPEAETADTDGAVVESTESTNLPLITNASPALNLRTQSAMTLADFQHLAIHTSPTIQHGSARVVAAQGQHVQAGLYPNPRIGYHGVNMGNRGTAGRQSGFIEQRIVTGGKLELDQQMACQEIQNQQALLTAAQQRVMTDVRSRFYAALIAQRNEELAHELYAVADDLTKSTQQLLKAGQTSENALLQAEIEVEQANIFKDNATNALQEAWRQLAVVVGTPQLPHAQLDGDFASAFPQRDLDTLSAQLLASHPLITAAQARIDRAAIAIVRAEREVIPDINFLAGAGRTNHTGDDTARAQLSIELPLWDKNEGNILSAKGNLSAAKAEKKRIELHLQQQIATTYRQYANAQHQAQRYRDRILPKAKQSLDLVRKGYNNGQVEYLMLLNSHQKFVQVNIAYTDSLEDLQQAAALLEGQLLTNSLAAD